MSNRKKIISQLNELANQEHETVRIGLVELSRVKKDHFEGGSRSLSSSIGLYAHAIAGPHGKLSQPRAVILLFGANEIEIRSNDIAGAWLAIVPYSSIQTL